MGEQSNAEPSDSRDPYTMSMALCDEDGIVRGGGMHQGIDYTCTGHAHFAGEHIYCTSVAHKDPTEGLPADLVRVLRDQSVIIERDGMVFAAIARAQGFRS